ncbi:hypothetical protein LP414_09255 [Polaromonas sp. P1(28)-13]|nr:hypothetical protein LP414_09255 [Polaromonas sp. P1(28)-13]
MSVNTLVVIKTRKFWQLVLSSEILGLGKSKVQLVGHEGRLKSGSTPSPLTGELTWRSGFTANSFPSSCKFIAQ